MLPICVEGIDLFLRDFDSDDEGSAEKWSDSATRHLSMSSKVCGGWEGPRDFRIAWHRCCRQNKAYVPAKGQPIILERSSLHRASRCPYRQSDAISFGIRQITQAAGDGSRKLLSFRVASIRRVEVTILRAMIAMIPG